MGVHSGCSVKECCLVAETDSAAERRTIQGCTNMLGGLSGPQPSFVPEFRLMTFQKGGHLSSWFLRPYRLECRAEAVRPGRGGGHIHQTGDIFQTSSVHYARF